jgi:hypothetical protein
MKKEYLKTILNWIPTGRKERGRPKQDGKKANLELWKNAGYEMETGRADFIGDWVSNDVDTHHRMTTYIHTMGLQAVLQLQGLTI